ncbi:MAG: nucleotidyltransferase family protein [Flavobacteriales bacterium]|nr:nucleotidyltransferase family protein [Flavobacteriales bacterium]
MISIEQKNIIKKATSKFNPKMVAIFGSYARNEQTTSSDLDVLIDFESNINLLELIGLEQELSELLGIKVDLVTVKSVNEKLKSYINTDLIRIV